jgi:hypothetical protein
MRQTVIGFILTCAVTMVIGCGSTGQTSNVPVDGHTIDQTVAGTAKPATVPAPVAAQPNPPAGPSNRNGGEASKPNTPAPVATNPPSVTWDGKTHDGKVFTFTQIAACRKVLSKQADASTLAQFGLTMADCQHFGLPI